MNVVSSTRGAIRKRTGSTLFTPTPPAVELNSLFAATISGTKWLIAAGGGKIYSINTAGVVVEIGKGFNATARWTMVQGPAGKEVENMGPVYMVNGVDPPQQWSGSGEVKAWTGKKDETHYATEPFVPNGKWMVFAGNRVWMTGVSSDPSAVWFSETVAVGAGGAEGDPTDWPTTNVVRFDASDGGAITGIGTIGPYLLVFKRHKVWVIHDINTGANRRLADNIGCVAHRSIVETPGGTFFLTADQGIYMTDGARLHEMSYNVRPTILAINQTHQENAAGEYLNNHYYLSFPSGTSATNNRTLDYDVQLKSWWPHDLAANQWVHAEPAGEISLYACTPGSTKGVVRAFVPGVYTDVGEPYAGAHGLSAYWFGAWIPFFMFIFRHRLRTPHIKKRIRQVHFDGSGTIIPLLFKNFSAAGTQQLAAVGNTPEFEASLPVNFNIGEQIYGNENTEQLYGGLTYGGIQMLFGGSTSTQQARIYAPGVANLWSVGFGNSDSSSFEVDSYTFAVQFRKS